MKTNNENKVRLVVSAKRLAGKYTAKVKISAKKTLIFTKQKDFISFCNACGEMTQAEFNLMFVNEHKNYA